MTRQTLVDVPVSREAFVLEREFLVKLGLLPQEHSPRVFVFPDRVRRAFRSPTRQRISEWAERYFEVVEGSRQGAWRNVNSPYLAGHPGHLAPALRARDRHGHPAPGGQVQDRGDHRGLDRGPETPAPSSTSSRMSWRPKPCSASVSPRCSPGRRACPRISPDARTTCPSRACASRTWTSISTGRGQRPAWPPRPSGTRSTTNGTSTPLEPSKKEASSADLAAKRQRTFRDRKQLKISTPTTEAGPIWKAFQSCAARFYFYARCPKCGHFQRLYFTGPNGEPRTRWPEAARDPDLIEEHRLAWYECALCADKWDDYKRDKAVAAGQWREERTGLELEAHLEAHRPRRVGFHLSALYSPMVSLSEVVGGLPALQGRQDEAPGLHERLFGRALGGLPRGAQRGPHPGPARRQAPAALCPGGGRVATLVAGVDTQQDHFVYVIRAIGWGPTEESWKVREGVVHSFEALEQVLWADAYQDIEGNRYIVQLTGIDAMGTRTKAIYDWARMRRGTVYAIQGTTRITKPVEFSKIDFYPGTNTAIPGGLILAKLHVNFFKNALSAKLAIAPDDPGAFHLHAESTEDYARQMTAEYLDDKDQTWKCPEKKANHFWDCEVYALAMADILGVKHWAKPQPVQERKPEPARAGAVDHARRPADAGLAQSHGRMTWPSRRKNCARSSPGMGTGPCP